MRRCKSNTISALLCCVFLLTLPSVARAQSSSFSEAKKAPATQGPAISAYETIYDYVYYSDGNGEITGYHPDFGGCYINDENYLIVLVKPGTTGLPELLDSLLDDDAPVKYTDCRWTMTEVKAHMDKVAPMLPADRIDFAGYSSSRNAIVFHVNERYAKQVERVLQKYARREGLQEVPFAVDPHNGSTRDAAVHSDLTPLISINIAAAAALLLAALLRGRKSRH